MRRLLHAALVLLAGPALAEDGFETAHALYVSGDFYAAADAAEALGSADGDALAARALLAEAAYRATGAEADAALERALAVSAAALEKDQNHFESLLQRVIALGYKSRKMGSWPAHNAGLGRQTQRLIERALAADPNQAWGWIVRGGWNAEVLDGGGLFGRMLYGVSRDAVRESYEKAISLAPGNPVLYVEYARALLRLSIRKNMAEALRYLETADRLAPPRRL